MPLTPVDDRHALQILAGTQGRDRGHEFEKDIARGVNERIIYPLAVTEPSDEHVFVAEPAYLLLQYVGGRLGFAVLKGATAIATGPLATSPEGKTWLAVNGVRVSRCKSDVVLTLTDGMRSVTVGVSTKKCGNRNSTNPQLYLSTAVAFVELLRREGIAVSGDALDALQRFCGMPGYTPRDDAAAIRGRRIDPRRYFWEELSTESRHEWSGILTDHQSSISRLLFQKAYLEDRLVPEFLLHQTHCGPSWAASNLAIYGIEELIDLSVRCRPGFRVDCRPVRKGSYPDPPGVTHESPRFGIIQMQRKGSKQNATQLQFNLEANYFRHLQTASRT